MLKSRRALWVFILFSFLISICLTEEAEARRRGKSRFSKPNRGRVSFRLARNRSLFGRNNIRQTLFVPVNFPISAQSALVPRFNSFNDPTHGGRVSASLLLNDRPVVVDVGGQNIASNDSGLPLSSFCNFDCGQNTAASISASRVLCWVPRDGSLAVVPFSVSGSSSCQARRNLCQEVSRSRRADSVPFVCRDLSTNEILVRNEATFDEFGRAFASTDDFGLQQQGGGCRNGRCRAR